MILGQYFGLFCKPMDVLHNCFFSEIRDTSFVIIFNRNKLPLNKVTTIVEIKNTSASAPDLLGSYIKTRELLHISHDDACYINTRINCAIVHNHKQTIPFTIWICKEPTRAKPKNNIDPSLVPKRWLSCSFHSQNLLTSAFDIRISGFI